MIEIVDFVWVGASIVGVLAISGAVVKVMRLVAGETGGPPADYRPDPAPLAPMKKEILSNSAEMARRSSARSINRTTSSGYPLILVDTWNDSSNSCHEHGGHHHDSGGSSSSGYDSGSSGSSDSGSYGGGSCD